MKKRTLPILTLLLLVAAVVCMRGLWFSDSDGIWGSSGADGSSELSSRRADPLGRADGKDRGPSPRQLGNPSEGLSGGAKPMPPRQYRSTVNTEIQAGETLVMGGYRLPDGNHAFTFMTPVSIRMEDGSEAIKLTTRAMAVTPEQALSLGMDSLTTEDSTANHAEAWSAQETASIVLKTTSTSKASPWMIAPTVLVKPGQPAIIRIGGKYGAPSYSVEATVSKTTDGGFSIQSQVVQTTGNQP